MKKSLTAEYELTIIPEEDGYYAVRFPDFPGIITGATRSRRPFATRGKPSR